MPDVILCIRTFQVFSLDIHTSYQIPPFYVISNFACQLSAGKRFITLQAVGALNDYAGHASLQLELKMQAAQDTIKGAMEEMRNHHDAIYANEAKIARAQEDGRIHREAIEKLSQHAGIRVLPGQAADWSQQASALDTRGFAMANTAGGFGNLAKTTKPGGVGVSGGGGAGGGFAQVFKAIHLPF